MKKVLWVGVMLAASMSADAVFAQSTAKKMVVVKEASSSNAGGRKENCLLDAFNSTLVSMANEGQKSNVITFKSSSNVKKSLKNIQSKSCAHSQNITISTQDKLIVVTSTSANNSYEYYAWYKDGNAVIARLTSSYHII